MEACSLGKLIKTATEKSGISNKRLTKPLCQKDCVTTLSKAGVPHHKIIQVTGHRNVFPVAGR